MTNEFNQKTALRTRRMPFKPTSQDGDADYGANVLPVGTHLGEFEVLDLIGEGGFGIVYLAYDHSLERQVALKEYMPSGLAKRTTQLAVTVRSQHNIDTFTAGLKSFINEARILAQFDSPALVKVHRFWEGNGTAYMVMPFYEGITLKQALKQRRVTPSESWIRILLADLFDAMEIIHNAHCLHRDIAPDNILLLKDGRPLLLDFGAARRVIGDLTQCLTAILKPGYAPIEQYADIAGLRQGPWTDIYALAAVVYYLICGKAPAPAVARMVHDELVPAREVGKGRYSAGFLSVIDKALSVKPEQRYRSIAELRDALDIMDSAPRTLPDADGGWATTVMRTSHPSHREPHPDMMPDLKTRIAPPAEHREPSKPQRTIKHAAPYSAPHATESKRRPEWVVLAILLSAGVASGVYLGVNRTLHNVSLPWNTSTDSSRTIESSGSSGSADEETVAVAPSAPPASPQSSISSPSPLPTPSPPVAKATPTAPASRTEVLPPLPLPRNSAQAPAPTPAPSPAPTPAPSREDGLWGQASISDKAAAYEKYLREYPAGRYAELARLRLESKQQKPALIAEDDRWSQATAINSVAAYESYLKKYPKGRYAALAKDRLTSLRTAAAPEAAQPDVPALAPQPSTPPIAKAEPKPEPKLEPKAETKAEPPAQPAPKPESKPTTNVEAKAEPPPAAEQKAPEPVEKQASVKPAEPVAPPPAKRAQEPTAQQPVSSTTDASTGKKTIVLADQTMTGNFTSDPKTGIVSGNGKIVWTNGNQFEGTLVRGSKEGKGRFLWANGQRYNGDWAHDMPNGRGSIVFADGSRYEGDVKNGVPHGRGTTRFKSGDVYEGNWVQGKSQGHGRYTWANSSYWEGEFRDDRRTENGKMVFAESGKPATAEDNTATAGSSGK